MNAAKRTALAAVMALLCAIMTGCWSSVDVNQLAIVMGIAIDAGQEEGEYIVTAQIVRPSAIKQPPDEGAGSRGKPYTNLQKSGLGINGPIHEMMLQNSRRLYTAHNQIVIVSQDVATEGIAPVLDYFVRNLDGRFSVPLLIANDKAYDVLNEEADLEAIPARNVKNMLESQYMTYDAGKTTLFHFLADMLTPGIAPTVPMMEIYKDEEGAQRARVMGCAVFIDGQMKGALTPAQTRAMQIVKNELYNGYISFDAFGGYVSLNISESLTEVCMKMVDGQPTADIKIRQKCALADISADIDAPSQDVRLEIGRLAAEQIVASIEDMLRVTRDMEADVCGFGAMLNRSQPKTAEPLMDDWGIRYKSLAVNYDIEVSVAGIGAMLEPALREGG